MNWDETLRDSSEFYDVSVISNGFNKLEFVIKGRAHVTLSQSEAKCPFLGCPLSGEGRCS